MRLLLHLVLVLCICSSVLAQENGVGPESTYFNLEGNETKYAAATLNTDFLDVIKDTKLFSINTPDRYLQRTFLINKNGEIVSTGFMPSAYFLPNDNLIVITGESAGAKDSFNPYGAYDMTSALILGTFNNFISRIKIQRK